MNVDDDDKAQEGVICPQEGVIYVQEGVNCPQKGVIYVQEG